MLPAKDALHSKEHIKLWLERNPDQNFKQCIQESGDLVYIPDGWAHGTVLASITSPQTYHT